MKSIFSIFDQNKGADITAENPIKVEAESYGFEDMCICPDDITGTGSASCCIDRKDFKMWMKNLVMKILFLTSLGMGGQTSPPPPIFKIAVKKLFHIDSELLRSRDSKS